MRMTPDQKVHLLSLGAPLTTKLSTSYKEPIPREQRVLLTLRHLAAGESQISLSLQYRIERQTISKIISETSSPENWLAFLQQFENRWNLPHVHRHNQGGPRGPDP